MSNICFLLFWWCVEQVKNCLLLFDSNRRCPRNKLAEKNRLKLCEKHTLLRLSTIISKHTKEDYLQKQIFQFSETFQKKKTVCLSVSVASLESCFTWSSQQSFQTDYHTCESIVKILFIWFYFIFFLFFKTFCRRTNLIKSPNNMILLVKDVSRVFLDILMANYNFW